jgi:hypothetical protein
MDNYIRKTLASSHGSGESSEVYLEVDTKTGESELVISKTITERYPVTKHDKVMKLHDDLNRGGGRRVYSLKDLTKR